MMKNFAPMLLLSLFGLSFSAIATIATTAPGQNLKITESYLITQASTCRVTNISTGRLALRLTPNGNSRAGLDNGNVIALLRKGTAPWVYVRVTEGPNNRVNGLEGWVNSNYLSCGQAFVSANDAAAVALRWAQQDATRPDLVIINSIVYSGDYALANWLYSEMGGQVLLKKQNGRWRVVTGGGGSLQDINYLMSLGVPRENAAQLANQGN